MKSIRAMSKTGISKLITPLLGLLLVFSVSLHNHKISLVPDSGVQITAATHTTTHTADGCSACFLYGNIKLTDSVAVFSLTDPGKSLTYNETERLTPHSYLIQNKPSRSPPAI